MEWENTLEFMGLDGMVVAAPDVSIAMKTICQMKQQTKGSILLKRIAGCSGRQASEEGNQRIAKRYLGREDSRMFFEEIRMIDCRQNES